MQHRRVAGEPLQAERPHHVVGVQQPRRVGQGQRADPDRERVSVEQRQRLAPLEHQPARLQRVDQLGHCRQVGLAQRADRRQPRRHTVVERGHERLGHLRTHHAAPAAERVHPVQQRRASHLTGQRVAVRGAVRLDREPREAPGVLCGLAHPAQGAHPRVQAVDGLVALGQASRQLRRRSHPPGCLTGQRHRQPVTGDRRHVLHGQPGAGQDQLVHARILRVWAASA